ncbi:MAG: TIGR02281 family clan AA aspartic protease [Myxococcota bacterium]
MAQSDDIFRCPRRWPGAAWIAALGLALGAAVAADAEIYRWVDAQGKVHFTQDLTKVPPAKRAAAEAAAAAPRGNDRLQRYSGESPVRRRAARRAGRRAASGAGGAEAVYQIQVQKAGNSLRVQARVNDELSAPFIIDTGASHVVIPRAVVDRLGIDLEGARTARYSTANGTISSPLIVLDAVELGGARVEKVPAAVSDSMSVGLLGLSFFNRFQYQVDPARGLVTLRPNGLEEEGLIRGGRSEADWRSQFAGLKDRMRLLEERRKRVPESHGRAHDDMDRHREELERQYRALESEADTARVPFSWRE